MSARRKPPAGAELLPDQNELARFTRAIFKHCDPAGWIALRVFGMNNAVLHEDDVLLGAEDFAERVRFATFKVANLPVPGVFCPPVATFRSEQFARTIDILECPVVIVECDARPTWAVSVLTRHLGPPTLVVASGGLWVDPKTGKAEPKLHVYWRLRAPARTPEQHQTLRIVRKLACDFVAADASAVALAHPLRWAGSWHRKAEPRLARIVEENDGVELDLAGC